MLSVSREVVTHTRDRKTSITTTIGHRNGKNTGPVSIGNNTEERLIYWKQRNALFGFVSPS